MAISSQFQTVVILLPILEFIEINILLHFFLIQEDFAMNIFLKIKGIICLLFALGTLAFPGFVAPLYNFTLTFTSLYFVNLFGACFLGLALVCWFASEAASSELKRAILLSLAIADTVGFGFTLYHQLSGEINVLGWSTVLLWGTFAAGCWYFRAKAGD